ncbi:trp operon leader peptide [Escherichia coli]|nr:trp operon leader peptide [Escherichia coli]ELD0600286.1 trp operon leader peptide [Escherichia coli]
MKAFFVLKAWWRTS